MQVYKCLLDDAKIVAIKVLQADGDLPTGISEAQLAQFECEINIMRACRFDNIVDFLGACVQPVQPLLTDNALRPSLGHRSLGLACQSAKCHPVELGHTSMPAPYRNLEAANGRIIAFWAWAVMSCCVSQ